MVINYLTKFRLNSCCMYQRNSKFSVGISLLPGNDDSEVIQDVQHLRTDNNSMQCQCSQLHFKTYGIFLCCHSECFIPLRADLTVEEQLAPFKSQYPFRLNILGKPTEYGIKIWLQTCNALKYDHLNGTCSYTVKVILQIWCKKHTWEYLPCHFAGCWTSSL